MEPLNEKTWEPRGIQEVFTISPGKRLEARNRHPGKRPFIGALDNSNGVVQFVSDTNLSLDRNVLGVNYNGNGMGIGFYHPYECVFSDDVKRFHLRDAEDSEQLALFVKTLIEKQRGKFGYLYKFNARRMAATRIMIPIDVDGKPDYAYMNSYVNEIGEGLLMRYRTILDNRIEGLQHIDVPALGEKEWQPVGLAQYFEFKRGRESNMAALRGGNTPLVSAKSVNNGVKAFVKTCRDTVDGDCVTLNNDGDGGAGLAYYQPAAMALDTHVTALIPKQQISGYAMLFIARCISGLHGFFGHGLSISAKRATRVRVMLPVDDTGKPDFAYMEQYAMNMMLAKYKQYLAYLDTRADRAE